jgi:septum site-determining protein MinC
MNIVLSSTVSNYFEIFSLEDLDNIHETFRKFFSIKGPFEAKIFSINESISIHQLSKLKNPFAQS